MYCQDRTSVVGGIHIYRDKNILLRFFIVIMSHVSNKPIFLKYCIQFVIDDNAIFRYCQKRAYAVGGSRDKIFFPIVDWNYISKESILIKFCTQVYCWWQYNIYAVLGYITLGAGSRSKNILHFLFKFHIYWIQFDPILHTSSRLMET